MPAYWKSLHRIVSGDQGPAILRLRSRYEPDPVAGDGDNTAEPLEAAVEVENEFAGLQPDSHSNVTRSRGPAATVQPSSAHGRADTERSDLARHRAGWAAEAAQAQNEIPARPAANRLPADLGASELPQRRSLPQGPFEASVDLSPPDGERPDCPGPEVSPVIATAQTSDRVAAAGEAEPGTATPDEPARVNGAPQADDDDRQAVWLAELRADLDAALDAALDLGLPDKEAGRTDHAPAQSDAPQPIVVQIDHLELAITRPGPPAAHRPARQDRAGPVVTLEAYLAHSGGGKA